MISEQRPGNWTELTACANQVRQSLSGNQGAGGMGQIIGLEYGGSNEIDE